MDVKTGFQRQPSLENNLELNGDGNMGGGSNGAGSEGFGGAGGSLEDDVGRRRPMVQKKKGEETNFKTETSEKVYVRFFSFFFLLSLQKHFVEIIKNGNLDFWKTNFAFIPPPPWRIFIYWLQVPSVT